MNFYFAINPKVLEYHQKMDYTIDEWDNTGIIEYMKKNLKPYVEKINNKENNNGRFANIINKIKAIFLRRKQLLPPVNPESETGENKEPKPEETFRSNIKLSEEERKKYDEAIQTPRNSEGVRNSAQDERNL